MASTRPNTPPFRIGVDVGGTNTDCVLYNPLQPRGICGTFKTPTTPDVTTGITTAISQLLSQCPGITQASIAAVIIGTTHFINAVVQADSKNLRRVAVLRICGPYTRENPPFLDFPPALARIMKGYVAYLDGGLEFDGREIMEVNEEQIRRECAAIRELGITDIAVCGVFSPLDVDGKHEARVAGIVREEVPDADVVLSKDIGQLGFLERENATILNTSMLKFARRTIRGIRKAMRALGMTCPLFLTQNDGTLMDADAAEKTPIKTFNSGPTNSMSGAAYLAAMDERFALRTSKAQVIVADIGGTTCDVCALLPSGFPRRAGTWVEVGGVRCAFPMPEVQSIALGGGSVVTEKNGKVQVGPESVGHRLLQEGLVFGGKTLTITDVVVAHGKASDVGDASRVRHLSESVVSQAMEQVKRMLEGAIDSMKTNADDCVCIMVGGGSILEMNGLQGVGTVIRPPFHDCANAVGAAIARVSGEIDVVKVLEGTNEDTILQQVSAQAIQRAVDAGADPSLVEVIEISSLPLQYVQMRANRMTVRAVGPLAQDSLLTETAGTDERQDPESCRASESESASLETVANTTADFTVSPSARVNISSYEPEVDDHATWWISEIDLEFIATGASILACGGGGPGYMGYMAARHHMQKGCKLSVVDINSLPDEACIMGTIAYGAPTVTLERTPSGTESIDCTDSLLTMFPNTKMDAQIALEIGGMNAIRPLITGLHYGVPTVDGDFMGRAYPRLYMKTPYLYGFNALPCTQADGNGNVVTVNKATSIRKAELLHRKAGNELGLFSQLTIPPMTVAMAKKVACLRTTSLAWSIGRAVFQARQEKTDIMAAIVAMHGSGKVLYTGKIVHVHRYVSQAGYTEGSVRIQPIASDEQEYGDTAISALEQRHMVLPFQNEYLLAEMVDPGVSNAAINEAVEKKTLLGGEVVCTVPDLISLVGTDGYALGTQDVRYGVRVSVLAFVAHPHWYTKVGVATGGPKEFGYDIAFRPLGPPYKEPMSVIEEFGP